MIRLASFVAERLASNARSRRRYRPRPFINLAVVGPDGQQAVTLQIGGMA